MSHWQNKIVVITGGSAGLGRILALEFAKQGALPVLVGRTQSRLESAQKEIIAAGGTVDHVVADVSDSAEAANMVAEVVRRHGKLDVLVNNVGKSIRTRLENSTPEQFRDLMEANFMTAVNCSLPALSHLEQSSGCLINIGSLSSKSAWPFVGPYTTSKFALGAFNHQLRIEAPANIHVMLVCPGPIQRNDSGTRYDDQAEALPEEARKPGAGVSFSGIDPLWLAKKIIRAARKRKLELMVPRRTRLMLVLGTLSPSLGDWLLKRLSKK